MLRAFLAEADEASAQLGEDEQCVGQRQVPQRFQLLGGQKPLRRTGIAGDKNQLAVFRWRHSPVQMRRGRDRLAVLIKPHEGAIEVVARKIEICLLYTSPSPRD